MYEPSIRRKSLQYSCDICGEIPILRKRWCCDVCEDYDICDNCHQTQKERLLKKTNRKNKNNSSKDNTNNKQQQQ